MNIAGFEPGCSIKSPLASSQASSNFCVAKSDSARFSRSSKLPSVGVFGGPSVGLFDGLFDGLDVLLGSEVRFVGAAEVDWFEATCESVRLQLIEQHKAKPISPTCQYKSAVGINQEDVEGAMGEED